MEFRILGPLEVIEGNRPIEVGGSKVRALLALLLLHPNQVVSTDRLLEGLWGERPPPTAANTLQTHISHLRKALAKGNGSERHLVVTKPPGYVLAIDPQQVDARRFEALTREGRLALAASNPERAIARLTEALDLWRGPALADFAFEPFASSEITRLEELRVGAVADRIDAELGLGRHGQLAGELRQLVDQHPLQERLWGQLMLALYRCGRQADALRAFSELRTLLGEELGIEPSQDLQRLEEAILLQKPQLDWTPVPAVMQTGPPTKPVPHNLPLQLTSFIGRENELLQVETALSGERLVTLFGPGGVGKTRIALAAALRMLDRHPDGVFVVELAPLSDPDLVAAQTLSSLDITEASGRPIETLVDHLRNRSVLLLLDNCEHVLSASAELADHLLRAAPELHILATSREPLRAQAETTIRIAPLPVPHVDVSQDMAVLRRYESVQLLVTRARSALPDFEINERNAHAVAQICRRLDGMPLALELAAARIRVMSVHEIAERLDDRFRLLTAGAKTGPARQQTLRATVEWTYDGLSEIERILFNRLSVFAGAFSGEAAEDVCGFEALTRSHVLEVLVGLVDKSLVQADLHSQRTRYRILETLRQYGTERLAETDEQDEVSSRLLRWSVRLAETAEANLDGREQLMWLDILEFEHDNLRAALSWGLDRGESTGALRVAAALWRFWEVRGYLTEGRRWLELLLALPDEVPPELRAKAMNSAGVLAQRQSDYAGARRFYEASLRLRRRLGDQRGVATALLGLGNLAGLQGEFERGRGFFEESLSIGKTVNEPRIVAGSLTNLGWLAQERGDLSEARRLLQESLELHTELRDGHGAANSLHRLGAVAQSEGDWATARSLYEEALRVQRELGERYGVVWSLSSLAEVLDAEGDAEGAGRMLEDVLSLSEELGNKYCETTTLTRLAKRAWAAGDLDRAADRLRRAVSPAVRLGDSRAIVECLEGLARFARVRGDLARAARLLGATEAITSSPPGVDGRDGGGDSPEAIAIREALGHARFLTEWMAGRSMSPEEAARYASEEGG